MAHVFRRRNFCADIEEAPMTMLLLTQRDKDRTVEIHLGGSVRMNLAETRPPASAGRSIAMMRKFEVVATEPHIPKMPLAPEERYRSSSGARKSAPERSC